MRPLPSYAKRVEFLESTGTQWIDTGLGYFPDFEIGCMMRESVGNNTFGTAYSWQFGRNSAANRVWKLIAGGTTFATSISVTTYIDASYRNGSFVANGTTVGTKANQFASGNLVVFSRGDSLPTAYPVVLYYCRCYDQSGNLVRSFIPCRVNEEGMLWDEVTGTFFTNQGTSAFIVGKDIDEKALPHKLSPMGVGRRIDPVPYDAELDWVASSGTQYIDTLLDADSTLGCEIEVAFTDSSMNVNNTFGDLKRVSGSYVRFHPSFDSNRTNLTLYLGAGTTNVVSAAMTPGTDFHTIKYDPVNQTATIDSTSASTSSLGDWDTTMTFTLFARKDSNGTIGGSAQRLRKARFYRNGVLVMDLVPVRKGNDALLFDRVAKAFMEVSGTGTLTAGPDKNYSTKGLVMRIDGFYNQGLGNHDSTATGWKDLAGTRNVTLNRAANGWANNSLNTKVVTGGTGSTVAAGSFAGIRFAENTTVEMVYKVDTPQNTNGEVLLFLGGYEKFGVSSVAGGTAAQAVIGTSPSGHRMWARQDTTGNPSTIAALGTIHSVAVVFGSDSDATGWSIYSDGVSCIMTEAFGSSISMQTDGMGTICGRTSSASQPDNAAGQIYALRIYNRALTADEILHHFELDKGRFQIT